MKILIINHYIGSSLYGMDYRQYYLAREWVKLGHAVSILGADYSHLRIHQPTIKKDLETESIEGIRYIWIKTPRYRSSGLGRVVNILAFVLKSLFYHKRIARTVAPDLILVASTYVLDVYPAYWVSRISGAKLVYELHDLWPLSPMLIGGYSRRHPFIRLVQRAENFACRKCDYFISLLGNAKEYLVRHGLDPDKYLFIPNGYSEDDLARATASLPDSHLEVFERMRDQSRIIVGYAGGLAPSNAMMSLLDAAKRIPADLKLGFIVVGDGDQKPALLERATSEQIENISFLGPIPKVAVPDFLRRCDLLYAGGISSVLHSYGTSFNKVTDYMLAGKPILFAVDDPHSLVEEVGCGVQVPAEKADRIAAALSYLGKISASEREAMGMKGKVYAEKELRFSAIAKKILDSIGG